MHTIPDDDHPDYGSGAAISALRAAYPAWVIRFEASLGVYSAELRSENGHSLHYLAGHTLDELETRLQTATALGS